MEFHDARMRFADLKNLVQSGEHQYLEFKRVIASPEKIARELCAFANASGGTVLIGVDDNRTIVGLKDHDEELYDLEIAARELCEPPLTLEIDLVPFGSREVLVVYVPPAKEKPVCVVEADGQKRAYLRRGEESMVLSREEKAVMKKKHSPQGVTFRYGDFEQKLFRYLAEYPLISVQEYANLIGVQARKAMELLTSLAAAGILDLHTVDGVSRFSLNQHRK